jgi:hypothetical protein
LRGSCGTVDEDAAFTLIVSTDTMRSTTRLSLATIGIVIGLAGCGDDGPGVVTGNAFLVQLESDVNLAGMPVHLVTGDELQIDSALAKLCPPRQGADSAALAAAHARAWQERGRILQARRTRSAVANAQSRFVFDSVPPGEYRVWADTTVVGERWTWLADVRVRGRDTARVDLTSANPDENPFRCRG